MADVFTFVPEHDATDVPRDTAISSTVSRSRYDFLISSQLLSAEPVMKVEQKNCGKSTLKRIAGATSKMDLQADGVKFTWTPDNGQHLFSPGAQVYVELPPLRIAPAKPIRLQYKLNNDRPKVANLTLGEKPLDDLAQSICQRLRIPPVSIDKIVRVVLEFQFQFKARLNDLNYSELINLSKHCIRLLSFLVHLTKKF